MKFPPRLQLASPLRHVAVFLLLSLVGCGSRPSNVIHQERSLYRNIHVTEENGKRCMIFRFRLQALPQGCILLRDPSAHALEYSKLAMAGVYAVPQPSRVLFVGLGVGVLPKSINEMYPRATLDVVEIDPAVLKVARDYFAYPPQLGARVTIDDGRRFVRNQLRAGAKYDLIFLDAFNGDYIPEHLVTAEFLQEVKGLLAPEGAVVSNTFSTSKLFHSESATYHSVFGAFASINRDNRVILATAHGLPSLDAIRSNADFVEKRLNRYGITKHFLLPLIDFSPVWDKNAPILTDRYSPANLLNQ